MTLEEAKEFTKLKHRGQFRKQGTPYYLHPFAVSDILKENNFDVEYQIAGLFHDLLEDTDVTYQELVGISSKEVAETVRLVTKEEGYTMESYIGRIKKNPMAQMVKLADRLHNLSEAALADASFRQKYIFETEAWYVGLSKNTCFENVLESQLASLKKNHDQLN